MTAGPRVTGALTRLTTPPKPPPVDGTRSGESAHEAPAAANPLNRRGW
jgi:hypothetical protein